jgi:hypothetical protein
VRSVRRRPTTTSAMDGSAKLVATAILAATVAPGVSGVVRGDLRTRRRPLTRRGTGQRRWHESRTAPGLDRAPHSFDEQLAHDLYAMSSAPA